MKQITLNVATFEAIKNQSGVEAAVEAIRAEIQSHAGSLPIELTFHGPNPNGDKVAGLSFVNAAAWKAESKGFRVNLLTRGFAPSNELSIGSLFTALTQPHVAEAVRPDLLADDEEPLPEPEVIGLIVGSHSHPAAFIKFEP